MWGHRDAGLWGYGDAGTQFAALSVHEAGRWVRGCCTRDAGCEILRARRRARGAERGGRRSPQGSRSAEGSNAPRMAAAELQLSVPPCCAPLLPSGAHECPRGGRCSAPRAQRWGGYERQRGSSASPMGQGSGSRRTCVPLPVGRAGARTGGSGGGNGLVPGQGAERMGGIGAWNRNGFVFPQRLAFVPG